jgi:hypothetical protein
MHPLINWEVAEADCCLKSSFGRKLQHPSRVAVSSDPVATTSMLLGPKYGDAG